MLDADGDLFIIEQGGYRIVRSGPGGLRYVLGGLNSLFFLTMFGPFEPQAMSFDSDRKYFCYEWLQRFNHQVSLGQ